MFMPNNQLIVEERTVRRLISKTDIIGQMARYAVTQHPYNAQSVPQCFRVRFQITSCEPGKAEGV